MAHPAVVAYLRANKDRFSVAVLRQQLSGQGYPAAVIDAGMAAVYGTVTSSATPAARQRFFDFRKVFVYRFAGQKVGHFLLGLLVIPFLLFFALGVLMAVWRPTRTWGNFGGYDPLPFVIITGGANLLYFLIWMYCYRYRRWVFWGMLPMAIGHAFSVIGLVYTVTTQF